MLACPVGAEPPFAGGDRVLFLGDSITQDGRYVALVEAYLWATYPELDIDVVNAGLSSETVSGITEPVHPYPRPNVHDRLARALDLVDPDWVVVCYGMNDGIYHPVEPRILDTYRDGLTGLVDKIAAHGARVILMTPPSFDADAEAVQDRLKAAKADDSYGYKNPFANYDETLVALAAVVKSLTGHQGVERVIDIHGVTEDYLRHAKAANPDYQYGDGVHPPVDGHLVIASGVLNGLGCEDAKAHATLVRLTGIAIPTAEDRVASEEQVTFREALFARSSLRSAAYRTAISVAARANTDPPLLREADKTADNAERLLRDSIPPLLDHDPLLKPYSDAAIRKWQQDIQALEALDATETYPTDSILFIGSSSVRLWNTIAEDMWPYSVIQRGYGGAKYSDLAVFAQRLITPHRYRAMVIFVGNDVVGKPDDRTPEEVEGLARHICNVSLEHQPTAPVFIVEITPTASRFKTWPEICAANAKLRGLSLTQPGIHFIATAEHYLDAEKRPRGEFFREDQLHQNEAGYALWTRLIKQSLAHVLEK